MKRAKGDEPLTSDLFRDLELALYPDVKPVCQECRERKTKGPRMGDAELFLSEYAGVWKEIGFENDDSPRGYWDLSFQKCMEILNSHPALVLTGSSRTALNRRILSRRLLRHFRENGFTPKIIRTVVDIKEFPEWLGKSAGLNVALLVEPQLTNLTGAAAHDSDVGRSQCLWLQALTSDLFLPSFKRHAIVLHVSRVQRRFLGRIGLWSALTERVHLVEMQDPKKPFVHCLPRLAVCRNMGKLQDHCIMDCNFQETVFQEGLIVDENNAGSSSSRSNSTSTSQDIGSVLTKPDKIHSATGKTEKTESQQNLQQNVEPLDCKLAGNGASHFYSMGRAVLCEQGERLLIAAVRKVLNCQSLELEQERTHLLVTISVNHSHLLPTYHHLFGSGTDDEIKVSVKNKIFRPGTLGNGQGNNNQHFEESELHRAVKQKDLATMSEILEHKRRKKAEVMSQHLIKIASRETDILGSTDDRLSATEESLRRHTSQTSALDNVLQTPLQLAWKMQATPIVCKLLDITKERLAALGQPCSLDELVYLALADSDVELVQQLLHQGASVHHRDVQGMTALQRLLCDGEKWLQRPNTAANSSVFDFESEINSRQSERTKGGHCISLNSPNNSPNHLEQIEKHVSTLTVRLSTPVTVSKRKLTLLSSGLKGESALQSLVMTQTAVSATSSCTFSDKTPEKCEKVLTSDRIEKPCSPSMCGRRESFSDLASCNRPISVMLKEANDSTNYAFGSALPCWQSQATGSTKRNELKMVSLLWHRLDHDGRLMRDLRNRSLLHLAVQGSDTQVAQFLADCCPAMLTMTDAAGLTATNVAIQAGRFDLAWLLLNAEVKWTGGDVSEVALCTSLRRSLILAAARGSLGLVRHLLLLGADVGLDHAWGYSALHTASCNSSIREDVLPSIMELLTHGTGVNLAGRHGLTPLHLACHKGNEQVVKLLIDYGAVVSAETDQGESCLHMLSNATQGVDAIMALLMGAGLRSQIDSSDTLCLRTPLQRACARGNYSLAKALIREGASVLMKPCEDENEDDDNDDQDFNTDDINDDDSEGFDVGGPLHLACQGGDLRLVNLLLVHGALADVNSLSWHQGRTPLHFATMHNASSSVVALLLQRGADVKAQDYSGLTPAFLTSDPRLLRQLHDEGCRLDARTTAGDCLLHFALRAGHEDVVLYLIQTCPALLDDFSAAGESCFAVACRATALPLVEQLLDHCPAEWTMWCPVLRRDPGAGVAREGRESTLLTATRSGRADIVRSLLRRVKPALALKEQRPYRAWLGLIDGQETALHHACRARRPDIVRLIVEEAYLGRCCIAVTDPRGNTSLHLACLGHRPSFYILRFLLVEHRNSSHKVKDLQNRDGRTALDILTSTITTSNSNIIVAHAACQLFHLPAQLGNCASPLSRPEICSHCTPRGWS